MVPRKGQGLLNFHSFSFSLFYNLVFNNGLLLRRNYLALVFWKSIRLEVASDSYCFVSFSSCLPCDRFLRIVRLVAHGWLDVSWIWKLKHQHRNGQSWRRAKPIILCLSFCFLVSFSCFNFFWISYLLHGAITLSKQWSNKRKSL